MRPAPGQSRSYQFPTIERFTSSSGLWVAVAPMPRLPIVTIVLMIDGGAEQEIASEAGTALLMSRALSEGTDALSGDDVAERFEGLGTSLEPAVDWRSIELECSVLSSNLPAALELIAQLVRAPAFRSADVLRLRDERMAELLQRDTDPRELADDTFANSLFERGSRLSLPIGGGKSTVAAITADHVRGWHRRVVTPERMSLIVAGDTTAETVEAALGRSFGGWRPDGSYPFPPLHRVASAPQRTCFVGLRDAPQSELRVGQVGPARAHEDYYALVVMNAILGGLFGSRINLNLREAHGYTYGASSGFAWRRDSSTFVVSTAVGAEVTVAALQEIGTELARIRSERVQAAELSLALEHLEGVFPLRFETCEAVASALAMQRAFQLPESYFDEYRSRIRSITEDDVLRAAVAHLNPERMSTTVVGNPELIDAVQKSTKGAFEIRRGAEDSVSDVQPTGAS